MELTEEQYQEIKGLPPKRRGHVRIGNKTPLNALIYRCEHGCKRRSSLQRFGNRRVIWIEAGGGTRSIGTGVQGDGSGKRARVGRGIGKRRGGRDTKIRAVTAEDRRTGASGSHRNTGA
ncbi:MAG: hypothetical protein LBB48_02285 [Treponema sp.]|nr:hypothetical protein [Treponema sp.]